MSDRGDGWIVEEVVETGSTNADLLDRVERSGDVGSLPRMALRTDHQTAGRGRLDRRWDAPPGSNLLVSFLVPDPPTPPQLAVQVVALAAVEAVDSYVGAGRAALKWPNDLLLDGRKLAGVLAQRHSAGPVVIGLGLNVGWAPADAACLAAAVPDRTTPTPAELLGRIVANLDEIGLDRSTEAAAVAAAVRPRLDTLGRRVRVELPGDRVVTGVASGLADDGRLGVNVDGDAGAPRWFDVGDVVHLRPET